MKIIHHNDADGHCAASIIRNEFLSPFEEFKRSDVIEYSHNLFLEIDENDIREGERVFIVDLALDHMILTVIGLFVMKKCKIVHIDHHISGKKYYDSLEPELKKMYDDNVTTFYNSNISASMLCWVYANMSVKERDNPMDVKYDFTDTYSHVGFDIDTPDQRECHVPMAIRYIDDNDVWRHKINESKYFALGYQSEKTDPFDDNDFWSEVLYGTQRRVLDIIRNGQIIQQYQERTNIQIQRSGFEVSIDGFKGFAINCPFGNANLFGQYYDAYDFVVKYSYDGKMGKWRYTFYAKENSPFDCAKVCQEQFNGGGHKGAAGGWLEYNCFNKDM